MNNEYIQREKYAREINEKVSILEIDLLIVGSVAYNPEAVTSESDLDLLGICNFETIDFLKLYEILEVNYDKAAVDNARNGVINNLSIVWVVNGFETGLHLWDISAFNNVVNFTGPNTTFRSEQLDGAINLLKARSDKQIFRSLSGIEKEINKEPQKVFGGTVLKFFPYTEDAFEFYPDIQVYNLLLNPIILSKNNNYIENGIRMMEKTLKEKLLHIYGELHVKEINLVNPLPEKIKRKLSQELRMKLETFF